MPPTADELIEAISDTVGSLVGIGAIAASADNDRFEAYAWSIVVRAAIAENAVVTYRDPDKTEVTDLLFRTSPGSISSKAQPFTHALIQFPEKPELEAHIGIKIQGKSRVPHECDVVVLPSVEADTCRISNTHPRHSSVVIAAECKYYYSNLPFRLSREFLGLCKEMRAVDCYFAVNTSKESVEKVLAYYRCHCETLVLPSASGSETLLHAFRKAFRDFKRLN
ncbi:MAG: hypothetical protein WA252_03455 [Candidatus Sulfotelmatobacter sp.]